MVKSSRNLSSVTIIGLDIAKNVFQVHGADAAGACVVAKAVRRGQLLRFFLSLPPCLIGIEACGSAHHWARSLIALGHRVKLIPPAYVKPYVRRNKNDAVDAAAICEAVGRANMRFVPVRSVENQAQLMRHRARELLMGNRTRMLNALRGHLAEIGVVAAQGVQHAYALKRLVADGVDESGEIVVADCVRKALAPLVHQIDAIDAEIAAIDEEIGMLVAADATARRLMTIPGIGPLTASAIVATAPETSAFASGREFAAFLGLTPRQNTGGGKERLGRITKMGDRYLRKLLVVGACATLSRDMTTRCGSGPIDCWSARRSNTNSSSPPSRWPTRSRALSLRCSRGAANTTSCLLSAEACKRLAKGSAKTIAARRDAIEGDLGVMRTNG